MARSAAVNVRDSALSKTSILPESQEVRFLDTAVTAGAAGASVLWTATRPTLGGQVGWAAFFTAIGVLAAVEGRGELRYGGFGVLAANSSYLLLRLAHPVLNDVSQG